MAINGPVSVEISLGHIDTGAKIAMRSFDVPHVSDTPARADGRSGNGADLRRPTFKKGDNAAAGANGSAASASLIERLRRKEPAALEQLYDQASGKAFGLAYRILGDGAAAEDIVQDVFLWVWNNTARIDSSRGNVESFLMTLIHRRSIDALRARARREALPVSPQLDVVDEAASDLLGKVMESVTREEVARAMNELSAEQRHVIEQSYFEGLTQREISEIAGLPIGTVKSRMRLGMDRLRTAFGLGGKA